MNKDKNTCMNNLFQKGSNTQDSNNKLFSFSNVRSSTSNNHPSQSSSFQNSSNTLFGSNNTSSNVRSNTLNNSFKSSNFQNSNNLFCGSNISNKTSNLFSQNMRSNTTCFFNNNNNNNNNNNYNNYNNNNNNVMMGNDQCGITDLIDCISIPIVIRHHSHPLICCNTLERSNNGTNWNCNNCYKQYNYDQPSFYCTFCDYDICINCVGNLKLKEIQINDFCQNKCTNGIFYSTYNWSKKYSNHEHLLTSIKRNNEKCSWTCNACNQNYLNINPSFYCSLCDYDICFNCFYKNQNSIPKCNNFKKNTFTFRKPVIYLYPEKQMNITIKLNIMKSLKVSVVYPKFNEINNTWKVKAEPNGDIILNNKKYPYLFYELDSYISPSHNEGFIVKDEEAETFLENKLKILGLNEKESTDFITYWLPVLLKNKMSLCTFQNDIFFNSFKLNIEPKPDTLIRIFLSIKKIDSIPDIKEQKLEKVERKGYTVIEWGGTNLEN